MTDSELKKLTTKLKKIEMDIVEKEEAATVLKEAIQAEMTARNTDELHIGPFKIKWTRVTSNKFDTTAFKAAMPDLYARFIKITNSRRFTVA